jgi:hypothetical protein
MTMNRKRVNSAFALKVTGFLLAASLWLLSADKEIDTEHSTLKIHVGKAGLFSAAGHDHRVTAPFAGGSFNDGDSPQVAFTVDARKLTVVEDNKLSAEQQTEVQHTMHAKVLHSESYPLINTVPNTANMEWNWLTFNGAVSPMTTPLVVQLGSHVRIRFVNIGMDHHPIHLHGHTFVVTGTEAGRQPETLWGPANTVLVGVAQARDIEFVANNPGEWMLHCHMPHHNMNAMSDLLGDRMMMTADTEDMRALRQMQTLADRTGFEHIHHAPIAPNANQVPGSPRMPSWTWAWMKPWPSRKTTGSRGTGAQ